MSDHLAWSTLFQYPTFIMPSLQPLEPLPSDNSEEAADLRLMTSILIAELSDDSDEEGSDEAGEHEEFGPGEDYDDVDDGGDDEEEDESDSEEEGEGEDEEEEAEEEEVEEEEVEEEEETESEGEGWDEGEDEVRVL